MRVFSLFCRTLFFPCLLIGISSRSALAHMSFLDLRFSTASGGLLEGSANGHYGFSPESPFYLSGEIARGKFDDAPKADFNRIGAAVGYEDTHWGLAGHANLLSSPLSAFTLLNTGVTGIYRFAELDESLPHAPLMALRLESLNLSTPLSTSGGLTGGRVAAWARVRLRGFFTLTPYLDYALWNHSAALDTRAQPSYDSRALRLVRIGPWSGGTQYSGIWGVPDYTLQIRGDLKLFPMLNVNFALTRVSLAEPAYDAYSAWAGFDRLLSPKSNWAISPSYEHYFREGRSFSYFTLAVRYNADSTYVPAASAVQ
jgi:hypothetical protein